MEAPQRRPAEFGHPLDIWVADDLIDRVAEPRCSTQHWLTDVGLRCLPSRFSTWLYTVTRSVAINQRRAALRRAAGSIDEEGFPEPADSARDPEETVVVEEILARFRRAMREDLEPLEAKILYLHFVSGLSLSAITDLLSLDNKSGAKAYIVNGKRKLCSRKLLARSRSPSARATLPRPDSADQRPSAEPLSSAAAKH